MITFPVKMLSQWKKLMENMKKGVSILGIFRRKPVDVEKQEIESELVRELRKELEYERREKELYLERLLGRVDFPRVKSEVDFKSLKAIKPHKVWRDKRIEIEKRLRDRAIRNKQAS